MIPPAIEYESACTLLNCFVCYVLHATDLQYWHDTQKCDVLNGKVWKVRLIFLVIVFSCSNYSRIVTILGQQRVCESIDDPLPQQRRERLFMAITGLLLTLFSSKIQKT